MNNLDWVLVVIFGVVCVGILGCIIVPMLVAVGRDMWQYALS